MNCPFVVWTSLPSAGGANGQASLRQPGTICGGGDAILVAGNSCAVIWSSNVAVGLVSKAAGSIYPVGISSAPANAIAADESAVYVASPSEITRVSLP